MWNWNVKIQSLCAIAVGCGLCACSGADGDLILGELPSSQPQQDLGQEPAGGSPTSVFTDFARPIYLSSGGWTCSVLSPISATEDNFSFNTNGSGTFDRYGQVFWNRDLINRSITVHSPNFPVFRMYSIFAGEKTLQFTVEVPELDAVTELYDCSVRGV